MYRSDLRCGAVDGYLADAATPAGFFNAVGEVAGDATGGKDVAGSVEEFGEPLLVALSSITCATGEAVVADCRERVGARRNGRTETIGSRGGRAREELVADDVVEGNRAEGVGVVAATSRGGRARLGSDRIALVEEGQGKQRCQDHQQGTKTETDDSGRVLFASSIRCSGRQRTTPYPGNSLPPEDTSLATSSTNPPLVTLDALECAAFVAFAVISINANRAWFTTPHRSVRRTRVVL